MKQLLFLTFTVFLNAETMTPVEHSSLHTYNKRSTLKHNNHNAAHKLHKIDEEQARSITMKRCKEEVGTLKLTHNGLYLYYIARTPKCTLLINALDGSIIDPEKMNTRHDQ